MYCIIIMATVLFPLVKGIEYDEVLVSHAVPRFLDLFHCKLWQRHFKVSGRQIQNTM